MLLNLNNARAFIVKILRWRNFAEKEKRLVKAEWSSLSGRVSVGRNLTRADTN